MIDEVYYLQSFKGGWTKWEEKMNITECNDRTGYVQASSLEEILHNIHCNVYLLNHLLWLSELPVKKYRALNDVTPICVRICDRTTVQVEMLGRI